MKNSGSLVIRYVGEKLTQRSTYILPLVVGTVINSYGQFLIPYMRGVTNPLIQFQAQFNTTPGLVVFSIFLGYCFPFLVGLYSGVMTRFGTRDIELKAQFPDCKPDPVFCVDEQGNLIYCGKTTQKLFDKIGFTNAGTLLGQQMWQHILSDIKGVSTQPFSTLFYCEATQMQFQTSYAKNTEGGINIYLTQRVANAPIKSAAVEQ